MTTRPVAGRGWFIAGTALLWFYRVPPPLVSGIVIWPFFLVAWLRIR